MTAPHQRAAEALVAQEDVQIAHFGVRKVHEPEAGNAGHDRQLVLLRRRGSQICDDIRNVAIAPADEVVREHVTRGAAIVSDAVTQRSLDARRAPRARSMAATASAPGTAR
jgi:hypothetical protein